MFVGMLGCVSISVCVNFITNFNVQNYCHTQIIMLLQLSLTFVPRKANVIMLELLLLV